MFRKKVAILCRNACRPYSRRRFAVPVESPWANPWRRMAAFDDHHPAGHRWQDDNMFKSMDNMMQRMVRGVVNTFGYPTYVKHRSGVLGSDVEVKYNDKEFKITLDVHNYTPDEIKVKIVDNLISVTGQHEEKPDEHGYVSREFTRHFQIPEDVDAESFSSNLTEDGSLIVSADLLEKTDAKERIIPINKEKTKE